MGNAQRAMETTFCEAPGCPEDAAPDARYCTRHMAQRIVRLDCSHWRCDNPAQPSSIFCEAHELLEEARSKPITPSSSIGGPALDAGDVILPQTKEPTVDPGPPYVICRIDDCERGAAPHTIGARKQGGRYDICETHLEELTQRARDTRRANREAADQLRAEEAAARSPRSHVPVGLSGQPVPLGWETPEGAPIPGSEGLVVPPSERESETPDSAEENQNGNQTTPEIRERACDSEETHDDHLWLTIGADPQGTFRCPGLSVETRTGEREQAPQPADVELDVCLAWCAIDGFPHEGECRDFAGRSESERLDEGGEPELAAGRFAIISAEALRQATGVPERRRTWQERGEELALVGREIDGLERALELARARWRAIVDE